MTGDGDRLVAIAARADAASPGPWPHAETLWAGRARDAEFIAHAREDIPWLLSQLRDARVEVERQCSDIAEAWISRAELADEVQERVAELADFFQARLPDGTGNGRAYNSYRVAEFIRAALTGGDR